jgi:hypothetical protein
MVAIALAAILEFRYKLPANYAFPPMALSSGDQNMPRSHWILLGTILVAVLAAIENCTAATNPLDPQVMKISLHTATPEEDGFIEHVLELVDKNVLPVDMVESTFLWAKRKPRLKFQYFKWGLTWRAEKMGITL